MANENNADNSNADKYLASLGADVTKNQEIANALKSHMTGMQDVLSQIKSLNSTVSDAEARVQVSVKAANSGGVGMFGSNGKAQKAAATNASSPVFSKVPEGKRPATPRPSLPGAVNG